MLNGSMCHLGCELKEPCIRWGSRSPFEEAIFRGKDTPDDTAVSYAKVAKAIEMPFGLWTWMRPTKRVTWGGHIGATSLSTNV